MGMDDSNDKESGKGMEKMAIWEGEREVKRELMGPNKRGLSVLSAAMFMIAEMAGSGVLALPWAVNKTGYIGIALITACAVVCSYTGDLLAQSWVILQERYDEFRGHVRYPFPAIGEVTFGKAAKFAVSCCINFSLLGFDVVYIVLLAQNLHSLLLSIWEVDFPFCFLELVVAACLLPLTWLGTPKDFWPVAVIATAVETIACVIILITTTIDGIRQEHNHVTVPHTNPTWMDLAPAIGTMLFAYGGHPIIPTIQNDMKVSTDCSKAVYVAYTFVTILYLSVGIAGYLVYGDNLKPNILLTISPGPALYVLQLLISCHLFCSFIIMLSPPSQQLEELLGIPKRFTWKRVVSRTLIVACLLFLAETVPRFGPITSLIGGSSIALLTGVFPSLFYWKLGSMEGHWPKLEIPLHIKVFLIEAIVICIIVGLFATYSSMKEIVSPGTFSVPCYVDMNKAADID